MLKGCIMSDIKRAHEYKAGSFEASPESIASSSEDAASFGCGACSSTPIDAEADTLPDEEILYDLADLLKVFADTTRIKILYCLMGKQLCVADIAETVCATQSAVSHQLRIL